MLHSVMKPPPDSFPPDATFDTEVHRFSVLLDADSVVDESKLRRAAVSGVPPQQRPQVWKLLLGIVAFEKSHDVSLEHNRHHDYNTLSNNVDADGDISRQVRRILKRSRTVFQPMSTHDKKLGRQGSTSGDSYDGDEDDEHSSDSRASSPPVISSNGRTKTYAKSPHSSAMRIIDRDIQAKFTRVICTYLQLTGGNIDFDANMVHLCAPFIEIMPTEADAFHAFNALMQRYQHMYTDEGLREALSDFNAMFRAMHPTLYDMFVLEEVDINGFVRKWLRGLLVQQLPRRALLRLWDAYFANPTEDGLDLHPFVCLVFIEHIKPELEDCDDSERMISLVTKLPTIDIDHVIAHAHTAREQLRERGIVT